jgi:Sec-independent protein translocase protein TatA
MDFLGIGPMELLLIALVAFLFLGPARMVEIGRSLGKVVREVRRTTSDLPSLLSMDEPIDTPPKDEARGRAQEPGSDARKEGADER